MNFMIRYFMLVIVFVVMACKQDKKYHDVAKKEMLVSQIDAIQDILDYQKTLNEEFKDPETSPLPDRYRKDFEGLDFFEPDTTYIINAKFVRTPEAMPFSMPTTTNRKSIELVYGIAYFTFNGVQQQLEIYQNQELMLQDEYKDYLFLPFTDLTNGEETYGGGRYIDMSIPKEKDKIVINFNKAYNPYCTYNKKYSCPIVPRVNHLNAKILAGVKAFNKDKK